MALYRPDPTYREAVKLVEKMQKEGYVPTTKEEADLILYYIKVKKDWTETQAQRLEDYKKFFAQLDRFLPNHNPVLG